MSNARPLMFWLVFPFLLVAVIIRETLRSTRNVIRRLRLPYPRSKYEVGK